MQKRAPCPDAGVQGRLPRGGETFTVKSSRAHPSDGMKGGPVGVRRGSEVV